MTMVILALVLGLLLALIEGGGVQKKIPGSRGPKVRRKKRKQFLQKPQRILGSHSWVTAGRDKKTHALKASGGQDKSSGTHKEHT